MNIKPYSDRVIVKKIDLEAKSAGGIILGEVEKDRETVYGQVVKVGDGKQIDTLGKIPMYTKVNDIVAFSDSQLIKRFSYFGEFYYHIRESDLIFKIEDEDLPRFNIKVYQTEGYEFDKNVIKTIN
jgi:chaperonin GroES